MGLEETIKRLKERHPEWFEFEPVVKADPKKAGLQAKNHSQAHSPNGPVNAKKDAPVDFKNAAAGDDFEDAEVVGWDDVAEVIE